MHRPLLFQLKTLHVPVGILHGFHNLLRMEKKRLALIGEGDMLLPPVNQSQLQLRLQGLDGLGNRRLGNMQFLRRPGKILQSAQGAEVFQLSKIHAATPYITSMVKVVLWKIFFSLLPPAARLGQISPKE